LVRGREGIRERKRRGQGASLMMATPLPKIWWPGNICKRQKWTDLSATRKIRVVETWLGYMPL